MSAMILFVYELMEDILESFLCSFLTTFFLNIYYSQLWLLRLATTKVTVEIFCPIVTLKHRF